MTKEGIHRLLVALDDVEEPSGSPASMSHSAISSEAEGSRSDGFRMKALPQASATGNIHRGLEQAVIQSTEIGAVNSWLRNQPEEVVSAAVASLREELEPYADGTSVRLPGAM